MSTRWYVATTKHQSEGNAARNLMSQGYVVYSPLKFTREVRGGRVKAIPNLRYRGYIFVAFDIEQDEHGHISNTVGVGQIIPPGETPIPLPPYWVDEMRAYETLDWFLASDRKKAEPREDIRPGDLVQIDRRDHCAHGLTGELMKVQNLIASVLCGMLIVKIPEIDLRKVELLKERVA